MVSGIQKTIKLEEKRILRLIDLTASRTDFAEQGHLEVQHKGNKVYYLQVSCKNGKRKRRYLGNEKNPKLKAYLGDLFRAKRLKILKEDLRLIEDFLKKYKDYSVEAVWKQMTPHAEDLPVMSFVDNRYEEIREWANAECETNPAEMPMRKNYAKDGTEVRSKSECILYNILYDLNLPFRCDKVYYVIDENGNRRKVYPDFQILCYDGTLIIIELLGILLDHRYAMKNIAKIQDYIRSGFMIGKNLILISDNAEGGTDSEMLAEIAEWIADRFYR